MPLVRVQVRNEYGLGSSAVYRAANGEDPKAVLEGVTVSGLVGILRQLGDLAEFSAEVFHELQDQVTATSARCHRITDRVKHIEITLPPLEKAILSKTNYIHLAYSIGSDWHSCTNTGNNHITSSNLPQFILESYKECRDPPHLQILDKFDSAGPGACLKRYSDPSFFKNAVAMADLVNGEKVRRGRKARKNKKKGSRQMNVKDAQVVLPTRKSGSRVHLFSPTSGRNSTSETISTSGMRSVSNVGDSPSSSDSRSKSYYLDSFYDLNFPPKHEEQENIELSTSHMKMNSGDIHGPITPDERNEDLEEQQSNSSLQEQNVPCSSTITWEEKTEIVKPTSPQFKNITNEQEGVSDTQLASCDESKLETEMTSGENAVEVILSDDENVLETPFEANQLNDVQTELNNYINCRVSMSETESGNQIERGVVLNPESEEFRSKTILMHEMDAQCSDSCYVEPSVEIWSSLSKQVSPSCSSFFLKKKLVHEDLPQVSLHLNPDISEDDDLCGSTDSSRVNGFGADVSVPLSLDFDVPCLDPPDDTIITCAIDSRELPIATFDGPSTLFWTNGGLLGLQPSKPPECNLLNYVGQFPSTLDINDDKSITTLEPILAASLGGTDRSPSIVSQNDLSQNQLVAGTVKMVQTIDLSECSSLFNDKRDACVMKDNSPELSSAISEANIEKSKESLQSSNFSNSSQYGLVKSNLISLESELPVPDVRDPSDEFRQENKEDSSSLRRKLVHDSTFAPSSSLKCDLLKLQEAHCVEQKRVNKTKHEASPMPSPKWRFENGSPVNSLPSSPPLEHMTISFQPINSFGTSNLKLRFHAGNNFRGNIKDMIFPSFQLIPEPTNSKRDIGQDSDDDTFSKVSCNFSGELSQCSFSNSEQWESEESPGSIDHDLYDALRRGSSEESILRSSGQRASVVNIYPDCDFESPNTKNGKKPFDTDCLSNLPNFDSVIPITSQQEDKNGETISDFVLQSVDKGTLVPHCADVEDKQNALSQVGNYPNDLQAPKSIPLNQANPTPLKPLDNEDTSCPPRSKDQDESRLG